LVHAAIAQLANNGIDWFKTIDTTVDGSEIPNNHLVCIKHYKQWEKLPTSTG